MVFLAVFPLALATVVFAEDCGVENGGQERRLISSIAERLSSNINDLNAKNEKLNCRKRKFFDSTKTKGSRGGRLTKKQRKAFSKLQNRFGRTANALVTTTTKAPTQPKDNADAMAKKTTTTPTKKDMMSKDEESEKEFKTELREVLQPESKKDIMGKDEESEKEFKTELREVLQPEPKKDMTDKDEEFEMMDEIVESNSFRSFFHKIGGKVKVEGNNIVIDEFSYDGKGPKAFFYLGTRENSCPVKADIKNYGEKVFAEGEDKDSKLRGFSKENITLPLSTTTARDVKWVSVYCEYGVVFGHAFLDAETKKRCQ